MNLENTTSSQPIQKDDTKNNESQKIENSKQNSDEFQQIFQSGISDQKENAKQENGQPQSESDQGPQDNEKDKPEQQKDSQIQIQANNTNVNYLYFIGVNSLLLNLIQISPSSPIKVLVTQLSIFLLVNLATYISLYKKDEAKVFSNKVQERSVSGYKRVKREITMRRILISLAVILTIFLTFTSIYSLVKISHLEQVIQQQNRQIANMNRADQNNSFFQELQQIMEQEFGQKLKNNQFQNLMNQSNQRPKQSKTQYDVLANLIQNFIEFI